MTAVRATPAAPSQPRLRARLGEHAWLLRRVGVAALTILLATVLVFFGTRALPGDPALVLVGQSGGRITPELLQEARERYGLDEFPAQYLHYLEALVRGDLGTSTRTGLGVGRRSSTACR